MWNKRVVLPNKTVKEEIYLQLLTYMGFSMADSDLESRAVSALLINV